MSIDRRSTIEQKIKELVSRGLDSYIPNIGLRNAVGPVLDFAFMSLAQGLREERILEFLAILFGEINHLIVDKVDVEFMRSDEFRDLLYRTSENCSKTRHRETIILNCKILVGSIQLENIPQRHSAEDFLSFVVDLTPNDITVGRKIYEQQKNRPKQFGFESKKNTELDFVVNCGWHKIQEACHLSDVDFNISLHKLSRAGLIKEIVGNYANYLGGLYTITPTFQRIMKFIHIRANDPLFSISIPDPL